MKINKINLIAFGFLMSLEESDVFYKNLIVSIGGILFNLLLTPFLNGKMFELNLMILFFNLVPITPLDGARILKNILSNIFPYRILVKLEIAIGFLALLAISILSLTFLDYLVIFNIIYLWIILIKKLMDVKYEYEALLLKRYLINIQYKPKFIHFNDRLERGLYRYKNIYTTIAGKRISER